MCDVCVVTYFIFLKILLEIKNLIKQKENDWIRRSERSCAMAISYGSVSQLFLELLPRMQS